MAVDDGVSSQSLHGQCKCTRTLGSIEEVVELLLENQYTLNEVGGRIKGTPADLLIQASTIADQISFEFSDAIVSDVELFYEFAFRLPNSHGALFQGFVPNNANAIFESTDWTLITKIRRLS